MKFCYFCGVEPAKRGLRVKAASNGQREVPTCIGCAANRGVQLEPKPEPPQPQQAQPLAPRRLV